MNNAINVLTDELRRLKAAGVKTISVSDESIQALRRAVGSRPAGTPPPLAPTTPAPAAPAVAERPARAPEPAPAETSAAAASAIPEPAGFVLPAGEKAARMAALREHVMQDRICCTHVRSGKKVVLGVGSLDAKIMFVGEAPGAEEEIQGEPFVGPAGQLLTKMIGAMGLDRGQVYIGNIMNWRPEMPLNATGVQYGNRPPNEQEMRYCLPYLRAQIEIVAPDLLVALGSTAAQGLLGAGSFKALGEVRGRWHRVCRQTPDGHVSSQLYFA